MVSCAASQQFRGDGEGLVDRLISVSQMQPAAKTARQEWIGRPLQKWCDDSASSLLLEPLETTNRRSAAVAVKGPSGHGKVQPRGNKGSAIGRTRSPKAHGGHRQSLDNTGYACPAIASSPKPQDLPLPKTLLRGRSISPPKDSFFQAGQMLVHPVAA